MSLELRYVENQPYASKVVDQALLKTKAGSLMFKLVVGIQGKVTNSVTPDVDVEPCKYEEIDVLFSLDPSNPTQFDWKINDLKRLGFTDTDISKLDLGHPEACSLVGKSVIIAPTVSKNGDKIYWNLVFKKSSSRLAPEDRDLAQKALAKHVENAHKRLAARNKGKGKEEGSDNTSASGTETIPF